MKKLHWLALLLCLNSFGFSQARITAYMYWFDANSSSAITTTIASPTETFQLLASVSTTNLAPGLHSFNIRFLDNSGNYSTTHISHFYKTGHTITAYEYWFDDAFNNTISTTITSPTQTLQLDTNLATTNLAPGLHSFNIRFLDNSGNYSTTHVSYFYKTGHTITAYEYWFNEDIANKISQNITADSVVVINTTLNATALNAGVHLLNFRVKDDRGLWTAPLTAHFIRTTENIFGYEYWFDNNYAKKVVNTVAATNTLLLQTNINTDSITVGTHTFNIRFTDANGNWSSALTSSFVRNNVLPLLLVQFNAQYQNNQIALGWKTTNEVNTATFLIQRSTDANNFTNIGSLPAKGGGNYNFTDTALPNTTTIYYRLKMVDKDGSFTYSNIVNCELPVMSSVLTIYPNPVKESLLVQMSANKAEKVTVQITNMQGKVLEQNVQDLHVGKNNFSINTQKLPKGNYILSIKGQSTKQTSFIKQ
jgi:hypothetical protein